MAADYRSITNYLLHLQNSYNLQICIKDFCGFIPINKELDEALRPFLSHTNPFCMYMKSTPEHWRQCLSMIRLMHDKLERTRKSYFGSCHCGLGEYVIPIYSDQVLLGSINVGFFPIAPKKLTRRICKSCAMEPALDAERAMLLYNTCIQTPAVSADAILPGLEMLAEYLGQTYHNMQRTHLPEGAEIRRRESNEDLILTQAIEYILHNTSARITVSELAAFCSCSESYLSRIFKRRTGVNINIYINKVRVEHSKKALTTTNNSIAEIASSVGFNDPNYFSRVFAQIMGIPPKEYRRRFNQTESESRGMII